MSVEHFLGNGGLLSSIATERELSVAQQVSTNERYLWFIFHVFAVRTRLRFLGMVTVGWNGPCPILDRRHSLFGVDFDDNPYGITVDE